MGAALEQEPDRKRLKLPWGKVMAGAASRPTALAVMAAGGVAAVALQSLPVLAIGAIAYSALVAWDLLNPQTWKDAIRGEGAAHVDLPDPKSMADEEAQKAARDLLGAKRELQVVLKKNPQQVNRYLELPLGSLAEMEDRAARLLVRLDDISRYLAGVSTESIRAELKALDEQARRTADPSARAEFQSARAAREQQLSTLKDLVDARDRLLANLSRIVAAYQSLPARVVHMRALDAQAADALSGDVNQELDRMNHELAAFEETLKITAPEVRA